MIRTEDLVAFMDVVRIYYAKGEQEKERIYEIVARLQAFDRLKEEIKKMVERLGEKH